MIAADCTLKFHGLGNRITILCSAYAAAAVRKMPIVLAWRAASDCRAEWEDLFEPLPDVEILKTVPSSAIYHKGCCYLKGRHSARQRNLAGPNRYTPEYWEAWRRCARNIKLLPQLAIPEISGRFHALHVRSLNPGRPLHPNWLEIFAPSPGSFLSVDSRIAHDLLVSKWPDLWTLGDAPSALVDRGVCRSLENVQRAARDMMMLCRAESMLVVGGPSTFRNLPHIGWGVPVTYVYQGPNP